MSFSKPLSMLVFLSGKPACGKSTLTGMLAGLPAAANHLYRSEEKRSVLLDAINKQTRENIVALFKLIDCTDDSIWFDSDQLNLFGENGRPLQNEAMLSELIDMAIERGFPKIFLSRMCVSPEFLAKFQAKIEVRTIGLRADFAVQQQRVMERVPGCEVPYSTIPASDVAVLDRMKWHLEFPKGSLVIKTDEFTIEQTYMFCLEYILDASRNVAVVPEVFPELVPEPVQDPASDIDSDSEEARQIRALIPRYRDGFHMHELPKEDFENIASLRAEKNGILVSDLNSLPKGERIMWMAKVFAPATTKSLELKYVETFVSKYKFELHTGTKMKPTKDDLKLIGTTEEITLSHVYGDEYCHAFHTTKGEHATIAYVDGKIDNKYFDAIPGELGQTVSKQWKGKQLAAYYAATALELAKAGAPETFMCQIAEPQPTIKVIWCGVYYKRT